MSRSCDGKSVGFHRHRAKVIFEKAYANDYNMPNTDLIPKAQKHKLCVRGGNVRDELGEYRAERKQAWYEAVNPYVGGGRRWALPYSVVVCESGANYNVGFAGAYGMLPIAWNEWGGPAVAGTSTAGAASPIHQDLIAHRGRAYHGGWWECG